MTSIRAEITGRRIQIEAPMDWPDGTVVEIAPVCCDDDDETMSPEEIAATLAAMDKVQPFDMTEAEILAWEAERRNRIEREKAEFMKRTESLRSQWE